MKKATILLIPIAIGIIGINHLFAQPINDTSGALVQQKENLIKEGIVIKIENMGPKVNTEYPELRPTVSA